MLALAFVIALVATGAAAQGVQTGTLSGAVKDQQGLVLPGVTVTASSPALQGVRATVTDANGLYTIPGLPPGTYTMQFELQGMTTVARQNTVVSIGGVSNVDVTMGLAAVAEAVQVTAETPSVLATPTSQAVFTAREINTIPVGRTPMRIAELAPGLTDNTPNAGQVTISGAFAYDSIFMIDGVDINDNLFAQANNVYIEEAIDQTQVLTSGISAEYGRFSGGVINLLTKSGGNTFSGSVRLNLSNPAWNDESPLEKSRGTKHVDKISKFLEGTFGGPVIRDRVWFFSAGRRERSDLQQALAQVGTPYVTNTANDRYEIKLTGTPVTNHTVYGSFVDVRENRSNLPSLGAAQSLDTTVLINRQTPNHLFVSSYNGVLGARTLITGQYSQKMFGFRNAGGTSTALFDSPFRTRGNTPGVPNALHYHAPFFSALDPEDRNNQQFTGSASYFLTTRGTGSHSLKVGGEHFTTTRTGGNAQSATNYVFLTDYKTTPGPTGALIPDHDAQGRLIPRFIPNNTQVQNWLATVGAELNIRTVSLYAQDHWVAGDHFTFDLGVRYETVKSDATGDIVGADTSAIVPRLGVSYDLNANGKTIVQASYAHYSGKYSEAQFGRNTNVGTPSRITYNYTGPEGEGFDFAQGMNLANYTTVVSGSFPTANIFFEDGLSSPLTKEITLSVGREFRKGYGRVLYTWRDVGNFIDDFFDDPSANGKITVVRNGVNFGTFDRVEYRNTSVPVRHYEGLQFISRYNVKSYLYLNGHYTVQLKNEGNFEGEAASQPGNPSDFGDYPEILTKARNFPEGRINDFQRSKLRLWAVYSQGLGRFGSVDVAPIWKYNSAQTYSLSASAVPLSAIQIARNPGYARLPGGGFQTLYFGDRGTEDFAGYGVVDVAATYQVPIWRTVSPWIKVELFNVLNNDKLIAWTTTITPDPNSPLDSNGLPTGYIKASNFGAARTNADYPRPIPSIDGGRSFQMALGLRF